MTYTPTQRNSTPANLSPRKNDGGVYIDVLIFLIPALQFVRIKFIGVLSGSDILLLVSFIGLFLGGKIRIKERIGRNFLIVCSLWLLSQIVTDVIRHTAFKDYARTWSAIGLTLMVFSVMFSLLYSNPRRITIYAWGLVVGGLLASFINPSELVQDDIWKFGLSLPVTLSVLLVASRNDVRGLWPILLTAAIGIFNFNMGFRNQGEILLGAAFYIVLTRFVEKRAREHRVLNKSTVIAIAGSVLIGMIGIYSVYQYAAKSGKLGEDARAKYESQSSGEYGVLLGGRVEMLASVPAVIDSPILGHGSFAKDPKYLIMEQQALALLGYESAGDLDPESFEEGDIPTHSHLMGAWVSAGIVGGLLWGWIWLLAAKTLLRTYPPGIKLLPLASYAAFQLLWDILFSPYGAQMRLITPFYVVIIMNYLGIARPGFAKAMPVRAPKLLKAI
jgi:hypothetical protein